MPDDGFSVDKYREYAYFRRIRYDVLCCAVMGRKRKAAYHLNYRRFYKTDFCRFQGTFFYESTS